jgi:hypothetical protein
VLQAGIHPKVVSEHLGHAAVSITLDTCLHVFPATQEEATVKIAELGLAGRLTRHTRWRDTVLAHLGRTRHTWSAPLTPWPPDTPMRR